MTFKPFLPLVSHKSELQYRKIWLSKLESSIAVLQYFSRFSKTKNSLSGTLEVGSEYLKLLYVLPVSEKLTRCFFRAHFEIERLSPIILCTILGKAENLHIVGTSAWEHTDFHFVPWKHWNERLSCAQRSRPAWATHLSQKLDWWKHFTCAGNWRPSYNLSEVFPSQNQDLSFSETTYPHAVLLHKWRQCH